MIKAIHNNVVLQKKVKQGQKGIYMPSMGDDSFISQGWYSENIGVQC